MHIEVSPEVQTFTDISEKHRALFCHWQTGSLHAHQAPTTRRGSAVNRQWWVTSHHHHKGHRVLPKNIGDSPGCNLPLNIHVNP